MQPSAATSKILVPLSPSARKQRNSATIDMTATNIKRHHLWTLSRPLLSKTYDSSHIFRNDATINTRLNVMSLNRMGSTLTTDPSSESNTENARKNKFFQVQLHVRDYELDQFDVVNNAVYSSYCQHGHYEFLRSVGIGCNADAIERTGGMMAFANMSLKFSAPLRSGDRFVVKVRASSISETKIFLEYLLHRLPNHEPILEAKTTAVWLDKNHQQMRLPSEVKAKFMQYYSLQNYS